MSRAAPLALVLLLGSACVFDPPHGDPMVEPSLDAKVSDLGVSDVTDAGHADADFDAGFDAGSKDSGDDAGVENRPPIAVADSATTAAGATIEISVLDNDSDPDGDPLSILSVEPAQRGVASATARGTIEYTPENGFAGRDGFEYRISDGKGGEATASVDVFVDGEPLVLSPMTAEINLNSRGPFTASGGVPPYSFRISSGTGEIDPVTGTFFSAGTPGRAHVVVEDAVGQSRTATVTFGNGDAFYLAGFGPTGDTEEVYRSSDGINWSTASMLPTRLYLHTAVVYEDRILIAGGRNETYPASQLVAESRDGVNWMIHASLPATLRGSQLVVFQQRLFLIGGRDGSDTYRSDVWWSTDGLSWTPIGTLPAPRAYGSAMVHAGEIWYAGGADDALSDHDEVWSSADGENWVLRGRLPSGRLYAAGVEDDGAMWFIGGSSNGVQASTTTWFSSGGSTFPTGPTLPRPSAGASALSWRNELWLFGGATRVDNGSDVQDDVLTVDPNDNWVEVGSLPEPRLWGAVVIFAP